MKLPLILLSVAILAASSNVNADYETDFQTKADLIIDWVADVYRSPSGSNPYPALSDPEKYTGPKMEARFYKYGVEDAGGDPLGTFPPNAVNANEWLREGTGYTNLFHFRFLGLAGILSKYAAAPGATEVHSTPTIGGTPTAKTHADVYIEAVLTRTDNYNAFTGEGTENHINMNRPSGWIFARLAMDSAYYMARHADNPVGYPDPAVKEAEMRAYLKDWAKQLYKVGSAEYDSSVYMPYNINPWINLFEATKPGVLDDPELHAVARAVLDWYAAAAALKYRYGIINGASIRGEGKMDRYDRDDEADFLNWLWFGDPADVPAEYADTTVRTDNQPITAIYAASSSYRPPAPVVALAEKTGMEGTLTRHGRSNYIMSKASEALEQFFIGPDFTLGSAQFPYGGWSSAVYRVNQWKLVADNNAYLPAVISGNNGLRAAKYSLHNAWTQIVQDENVLFQLNRIPSNAQTLYNAAMNTITGPWLQNWYDDFTQRYTSPDWGGFNGLSYAGRKTPINDQDDGNVSNARTSYIWIDPTVDNQAQSGGVQFIQVEDTFIAARAVDGDTPSWGSLTLSDFSDYDALGGFVIEVGSASDADYTTFAEFQAYYLANTSLSLNGNEVTYTAMDGRVITATYNTAGGYTEPEYDWAFGVTEPVSRMFLDSYDTGSNPPEAWTLPAFPDGEGTGRMADWSVDPDGAGPEPAESYDGYATTWPVFDGPNLKQMHEVLHVWDGSSIYSVDFSGSAPVFSSGSLPVPETAIQLEVGGDALIDWPTIPGLIYQLYTSDSLSGPWTKTGDPVVGDGSVKQLNGGPVPASGKKFWRVEVRF